MTEAPVPRSSSGIAIDPAELWEEWLAETPKKYRTPQSAMAFAVGRLRSAPQAKAGEPEYIVSQHIGWLKQYVQGMTADNWRDMQLRAERQLDELSGCVGVAQRPGIHIETFTRRLELARKFIAKEYNDPAQELRGDWIDPRAKPAHDALCLCLQDLSSLSSTHRATGPLVPWELKCQREVCAAPECDCPAVTSTDGGSGAK